MVCSLSPTPPTRAIMPLRALSRKTLSVGGEASQQGGYLDRAWAFRFRRLAFAQDLGESDLVCHPHRPAFHARKAVAVDQHKVDVGGAVGDALLEDSSAV